ncbi:TPA: ribosome silencing factor [bacterium]|nr:ribosome silencing factor [bacterium]
MSKLLKNIVKTIDEGKGEDIVIIDVSKSSPICDYFVICSAGNERLVNSLADKVEKNLKMDDHEIKIKDGKGTPWILIDTGEVIVHVFHNEEREKYRLEELWKVFPTLDYKDFI